MSSHYKCFSKADGEVAFLAGNISAASDHTLLETLPRYWALETDVFRATPLDICEKISARLKDYQDVDHVVPDKDKNTSVSFSLEKLECSFSEYYKDLIDRYKTDHVQDEKQLIDEFFSSVRFQLGEPEKIYRVTGLDERSDMVLSGFYTYVIFEIFFVRYGDYMVMLVFGSDE